MIYHYAEESYKVEIPNLYMYVKMDQAWRGATRQICPSTWLVSFSVSKQSFVYRSKIQLKNPKFWANGYYIDGNQKV